MSAPSDCLPAGWTWWLQQTNYDTCLHCSQCLLPVAKHIFTQPERLALQLHHLYSFHMEQSKVGSTRVQPTLHLSHVPPKQVHTGLNNQVPPTSKVGLDLIIFSMSTPSASLPAGWTWWLQQTNYDICVHFECLLPVAHTSSHSQYYTFTHGRQETQPQTEEVGCLWEREGVVLLQWVWSK